MGNAHQPRLSGWAVLIKALRSAVLNPQKHCPPYPKDLLISRLPQTLDAPVLIPDCQEDVLVNQYQIQVEQYTRTAEGLWLFREYETEAETIAFAAGKAPLTLAEIYDGVDFALNETEG